MDAKKPIGNALVELGLITRDQLEMAIAVQKKRKERLGELLVSLRFISEQDMLRFLSARMQTRYITAERLARLRITPSVLNLLPVAFAEQYCVLPIQYEADKTTLSVLMGDPQDEDLLANIRTQSRVANVQAFLALKTTISAGVRKFYRGDTGAFAALTAGAAETALLNSDNVAAKDMGNPLVDLDQASDPPAPPRLVTGPPVMQTLPPLSRVAAGTSPGSQRHSSGTMASARTGASAASASAVPVGSGPVMALPPRGGATGDDTAGDGTTMVSDKLFIETVNILIGLMELKPENMRGHSASVARFTKILSERMNLAPREVYFNIVAAYFHDLGMRETPHFTWINLTADADIKRARKYSMMPVRLFENVSLPAPVLAILGHQFERFDGQGFPDGQRGDQIPLGSRIIALVDAYEELARNPAMGIKNLDEAIVLLRKHVGSHFDPAVFNVFEQVLNEMRRKPRADTRTGSAILVVDPSSQDAAVVEQKLSQAGYRVVVAANTDDALKRLGEQPINLVVSEIALTPLPGIQFCQQVKANAAYRTVPFVFVSRDDSSDTINTAFDAGADDFLSKPFRSEMLLAKIRRLLMRAPQAADSAVEVKPAGGVSGSLKEVALADLLQLFSQGRKSGTLVIETDKEAGQIYFQDGEIINADYRGKTGTDAFYQLIRFSEGQFVMKSEGTLPRREINAPAQHLIMEGFRLWDEERAGIQNSGR